MYFRRVFVRCRPFLSGDKDEFIAAENDENKDPNVSGCVMFHPDGGVSLAKQSGSRDKPQVFKGKHYDVVIIASAIFKTFASILSVKVNFVVL